MSDNAQAAGGGALDHPCFSDEVISEEALLTAEQEWISQRREDAHEDGPENSVGLALSGGGIRSATFNLGILQAMASFKDAGERPFLKKIRYLCTVSGGGYIGGWLVKNWWRRSSNVGTGEQRTKVDFDFLKDHSPEILHLRRYSRYLAPEEGMLNADTWTMVAIWLRNTLLIQAMVGCWVIAAMLMVRLLASGFDLLSGWFYNTSESHWVQWVLQGCGLRMLDVEEWTRRNGWLAFFFGGVFFFLAWGVMAWELRKLKKPGRDSRDQRSIVWWVVLPLLSTAFFFGAALSAQTPHYPYVFPFPYLLFGQGQAVMLFGLLGYLFAINSASPVARGSGPDRSRLRYVMIALTGATAWIASHFMSRGIGRMLAAYPDASELDNIRMVWQQGLGSQLFSAGWCLYVEPAIFAIVAIAFGLRFGLSATWRIHLLSLLVGVASGLFAFGAIRLLIHILTKVLSEYEYIEAARLYLGPSVLLLGAGWVVVVVGLLGRNMRDDMREWLSRLGAWLTIAWVGWLLVKALVFHGPTLVHWVLYSEHKWIQWGGILSWLAGTIGGILAGKSSRTSGRSPAEGSNRIMEQVAVVGPYVALFSLLLAASYITNLLVTWTPPYPSIPPLEPGELRSAAALGWVFPPGAWLLLIAFAGLGFILIHRIDLNEFSMNHFYRNRLVRCYLRYAEKRSNTRKADSKLDERIPHPFTGFDFSDNFFLASLRSTQHPYSGPYPILCGAINTSNGGGLDTQERKAESFVFTPLACGACRANAPDVPGSALHAFRPTEFYADGNLKPVTDTMVNPPTGDSREPDFPGDPITMGTCMSISGAAVSPNWGYHTSPVTSLLLTLFNARLGWWLPNVAKSTTNDPFSWRRTYPNGFWGWLNALFGELSGSASPITSFVNVSDGGHFENLGIYELVRRKCRFIICCDAEQDGEYTFHGLGTAIRRCRIDFGAEISIDLSGIKERNDKGWNKESWALGSITYADGSTGTLLYIKLSCTGRASADVMQYQALNPDFPHESTGDQFFTESQFESYRKLGLTVGLEALEAWRDREQEATTKKKQRG
jgi:hypothetical protein